MILCGKIHEYLGMTLDFTTKGQVKITMTPYVKETVELFKKHDDTDHDANLPAVEHLFQVNEQVTPCPHMKQLCSTTLLLSVRCLLYTSPSPRDLSTSRMPSSA